MSIRARRQLLKLPGDSKGINCTHLRWKLAGNVKKGSLHDRDSFSDRWNALRQRSLSPLTPHLHSGQVEKNSELSAVSHRRARGTNGMAEPTTLATLKNYPNTNRTGPAGNTTNFFRYPN